MNALEALRCARDTRGERGAFWRNEPNGKNACLIRVKKQPAGVETRVACLLTGIYRELCDQSV